MYGADAPMSSWRRRYCPAEMQLGIVKETLPLFAMRVSTAHVLVVGLYPSW